jgi:hypothetical protein
LATIPSGAQRRVASTASNELAVLDLPVSELGVVSALGEVDVVEHDG